MSSVGTQNTRDKSFRQGQETTSGPARRYQNLVNVSLTSSDGETISPTDGGLFRGLIASVAGQVSIIDIDGAEIVVYCAAGKNDYGGRSIIRRNTNAATLVAMILDD